MQTRVLNYRIIVSPDEETGSGKPGFTAFCPTLGVADDGDTVEEALQNINGAIDAYVESLVEDGESVPNTVQLDSWRIFEFDQVNLSRANSDHLWHHAPWEK